MCCRRSSCGLLVEWGSEAVGDCVNQAAGPDEASQELGAAPEGKAAAAPVYEVWIGEMNKLGRNGKQMFADLQSITAKYGRK